MVIILLPISITLCILMDFPIHVDTIRIGQPIVHFKGSQVEFSKLQCISVHDENCFYLSNRVPTEIQKHSSMISHDQKCNFHNYLMHSLQHPLLAASSPRWA